MVRPSLTRLLTALWGVWFAVALVEPAGLMACATHGLAGVSETHAPTADAEAPALAHQAATEHADVAHGAMTHASMDHAVAEEGTREPSSPAHSDGHHDGCSCLGTCCSALSVAPPTVPVSLLLGALITPAVPVSPVLTVRAGLRAHALPFATAPPATPLR